MEYYLYINKNLLFDFLSRNIIAPDSIVMDIKRYRTISTKIPDFLFITHLKLDRKYREQGIAEPEFVCPVTLKIRDLVDEDREGIFVTKQEDGFEYTKGDIKEYNSETMLGMYIYGEIPLSRISKIYFDSQDDLDMFSRPSPDYWYPTNKFSILPAEFTEVIDFEPEEEKIVQASDIKPEKVIEGIRLRERHRAAILNMINATRKWKIGRYVYNVDKELCELLGVKENLIVEYMPHFVEVNKKGDQENIVLINSPSDSEDYKDNNQKIFNIVYHCLANQGRNIKKQDEDVIAVIDTIEMGIEKICKDNEKKNIQNIFYDIKGLVFNNIEKSPEEIVAQIPKRFDVLKAFLFVVKNSNKYEMFIESMSAYHVDQFTRRRAAVLWGAWNGLYGMPGEDFNKDNQDLWQFIEWKVWDVEKNKPSFGVAHPEDKISNGRLYHIPLTEDKIITAEDVQAAIIATPREKLNVKFYNQLLNVAEMECGSKRKAMNKGYAHSVASQSIEIKKGDELNINIRKVLETLLKDCKHPVPNKEKLFHDYVEDITKFRVAFDMDPTYWKNTLKMIPENKDDRLQGIAEAK